MKLGVITDEVTQDLLKAVEFARRHSLDGIELRSIDDMNIDEIPVNRIKEMNRVIKDSGLEVCNLSSSFFKCSLDSRNEYLENIEKLKRLCERAHIFGCKSIRGFAFFQNGSFEERLEDIAENFVEAIDILEQEKLKLLLEADPSVFTTNCKKLAKLLARLNHKNLRSIYDPGNDIYDPDGEKPFPEGFNYISEYFEHVHVKDAKLFNGKPESVKIGTGWVPYKDIFEGLQKIGYEGYVVLETHYRPNAEIPEELLKSPKGTLFSLNGDIASEESIIELKKIIAPYCNK